MKLVIAEKPNTAEPIASNRKAVAKGDGTFEGNGYVVTSAFGHLVELFEPEDYDKAYKTWELQDLPIIPKEFKFKVHSEGYRRTRFYKIKELLFKATEIINACDNDREGDNIFWSILNMAEFKDLSKCKRLKKNDYSDADLNKAFNSLSPLIESRGSYLSAETREKADWLFGMNLTRLITKSAKSGMWVFGRVQTPTLMMVCDAFIKNEQFKETPYWKVKVALKGRSVDFTAINDKAFTEKEAAETFSKSVGSELICSLKKVEEKKEKAPELFDLGSLQRECNKVLGMKMDKTLEVAQALYEKHRLTSYPRSDTRYLPESMKGDVIERLGSFKGYKSVPEPLRHASGIVVSNGPEMAPFNDKKVGSHYAIIPTTESPEGKTLSEDERGVYLIIVKRFIQAFMPVCIKKLTKLEFNASGDVFKSFGSITLSQGWRILDDALQLGKTKAKVQKEENDDAHQELPDIAEGEKVVVTGKSILEKKTKKPPLLNVESLSRLMETAGKMVEDKDMAAAMEGTEEKASGIGTTATRAGIVKRLYELEYIEDKGNFIIPTADGLELYSVLKDLKIASPELTGRFELMLTEIADGTLSQPVFLQRITALMTEHMDLLRDKSREMVTHAYDKKEVGGSCPLCQGAIVVGAKSYHCENAKWLKTIVDGAEKWTNTGCNFSLLKLVAGKTLSVSVIKELLQDGITKKEVAGFISSKTQKEFSARLKINENNQISFVSVEESGTEDCPKCKKSKMRLNSHGASCVDKVCNLFVYRKVAQKELTDAHLKLLLAGKTTGVIKGFTSSKGNSFDMKLKLNEDFKVEFVKP